MEKGYNIAGVQFRRAGKIYDFSCGDVALQVGDQVVVDTDRGLSTARVAIIRFEVGAHDLKPIIRKSSKSEMEKPPKITLEEVISYSRVKINEYQLNMKILTADIQFGGNKITIYFSSPGRVDFRELVKTLATGLKARVELKQVGSRDETKLIGGIGICGREYCCSSFLREFVPVSIRMAKNQNLALNPSKVSGGCGRLLCCLTYEDQVYSDLRKILPPRGTRVKLLSYGGTGDVLKGDILNQMVLVETDEGQQVSVPVADIEVIDKAKARPESGEEWGEDLDLDALSSLMDEGVKKSDQKRDSRKPQNQGSSSQQGRETRQDSKQDSKQDSRHDSKRDHRPQRGSSDEQGRGQSGSRQDQSRFDRSSEKISSQGYRDGSSRDSNQAPRSGSESSHGDRNHRRDHNEHRSQGDRHRGQRHRGEPGQGGHRRDESRGQRESSPQSPEKPKNRDK